MGLDISSLQAAAPDTPIAGFSVLYPLSADAKWYYKTAAGNVKTIATLEDSQTFTGVLTVGGLVVGTSDIAMGANYISNTGGNVGLSFDGSNNATLSAQLTTLATITINVVGTASHLVIGDLTDAGSYSRLTMRAGLSNKAFRIGVQDLVNAAMAWTPSTANGGNTFTTPVMTLTDAGLLTVTGGLTSTAGTTTLGTTQTGLLGVGGAAVNTAGYDSLAQVVGPANSALSLKKTNATAQEWIIDNTGSFRVGNKTAGTFPLTITTGDAATFSGTLASGALTVTGEAAASGNIKFGTGTATAAGLRLANGSSGYSSGWAAIYPENVTPGAANWNIAMRYDGGQLRLNAITGGRVYTAINDVDVLNVSSTGLAVTGAISNSNGFNITVGGSGAARATTQPTNAINILNGTAPVGTATNQVTIYSTAGECYIMDAAGNATLQSPHDKDRNWIHHCVKGDGNEVLIQMERMIQLLDEKYGSEFSERFGMPFLRKEKKHFTQEDIDLAAQPGTKLAEFISSWKSFN